MKIIKVFVYFGYIVPFGLLVILNTLIIWKATQFSRSQRGSNMSLNTKRKVQMTRMILFITFLYIGVSVPSMIVTGWLYGHIVSLKAGVLITNLLNCFVFSYPALNFFILYLTNKLFAVETRSLLGKMVKRRVSNVSTSAETDRDAAMVSRRKDEKQINLADQKWWFILKNQNLLLQFLNWLLAF